MIPSEPNKSKSENNATTPVPSRETIVQIHKNLKKEKNETEGQSQNTVINIEEEPANTNNTTNVTNGRKSNFQVMFGFSTQQKQPQQATLAQQGWLPWPLSSGPPAPPPGSLPLNYKPETRNSFVKMVLTLVLVMLIATAIFTGYVLATPDVKEFFQDSGWTILLPALILLIIVDYGMVCSPCTRQPPCSFFFLFLAVVAMSLFSAKITSHYKTEVVLYAIIATSAVVFVCILLACSNFDFTKFLLFIIVIATALSMVMITVLIVKIVTGTMMKPVILAILIISTVLQSIMLTIQLQMILGSKTVELNESDYALGAFMIYTSIVDIFLKMVQIIGLSDTM